MTATLQPLTLLRTLNLSYPTREGRPAHLSAASGLVKVGDYLYVVADDEQQLGLFSLRQPQTAGELVRLLAGDLPNEPKARKAQKPDLEALVVLPAFAHYSHGALFALGSGSKSTRQKAVVVALDAQGRAMPDIQVVDCTPLYHVLQQQLVDLNIEGAFLSEQYLHLLQRGNQAEGMYSAVISISLESVLQSIAQHQALPAAALHAIQPYDLGQIQGVSLHFTDASALPDGSWIFTAAAEATADSYNDGEVVGAAIGIMRTDGSLLQLYPLDGAYKIEGVATQVVGTTVRLWLVTDADSSAIAASLFYTELGAYPCV